LEEKTPLQECVVDVGRLLLRTKNSFVIKELDSVLSIASSTIFQVKGFGVVAC
jgi:hypothetical protein